MLEGITVLEVMADYGIASAGLWAITIVCIMFAGAMVFEIYNSWKTKQYPYVAGLCVVILVCAFVIGIVWYDDSHNDTKYIVTIDDSVNFNEFSREYEILSRDGDVYTIRKIR